MSETNAKLLFDYLDTSMASAATKTSAYTYTLDSLERVGWLTTATLVTAGARASAVSFPTGAVRLLYLFYENRQLFRETRAALRDLGGVRWRDVIGTPTSFIEGELTDNQIVPYPRPSIASGPASYPNGEPFGRDYPVATFVMITSDRAAPPTWFDAPCALLMLAHARRLESATQD
ncbi:MAG: hypothetical protein KC492_05160, partial [Myxococcales bacterium]|nr:hypothetical protein [Myxococcales bacterium]